jgi:hypothetical protein
VKKTPTGRRARAPRIQNIPVRTEEGRELREALTSRTPKLNIDYSEIERRIMERINKKKTDDAGLDELREWVTNVCVLVGNANRRGGADESLLTALNILRARALERGYVVPGINWSTYVPTTPEEREACAKVCDDYANYQNDLIMREVEAGRERQLFAATCLAERDSARECARRIRARVAT